MNASFVIESPPNTQVTKECAIAFCINFLMIEVLGNLLMSGIIYYEKNGCDPKKRSLFNQLISLFWTNLIAALCIPLHFCLLRIFVGPLPNWLGHIGSFAQTHGIMSSAIVVLEILAFRILQIAKHHLTSRICDNFWYRYFVAQNAMISCLIATINISTFGSTPFYIFLVGEDSETIEGG